jgi:hypothetical protein
MRFLRPIAASRFLLVSALIHLLLVILLGGRVLFNKYVETADFQSTDLKVSTEAAPTPPPDTAETILPSPAIAPAAPPAVLPSGLTAITSLKFSPSAFAMHLPPIAPTDIGREINLPAQIHQFGSGTAVALPGVMGSRTAGARESAGRKYGENPASEQAVVNALAWLQSQQKPDGTWGTPKYQEAFTGLALLCYLGHGETPQGSFHFGATVNSAINVLVNEGASHECRFTGEDSFAGIEAAYQHAICTYALCEAYTMTRDDRIAPMVKQAVEYILRGQRSDGGWAYSYDVSGDTRVKPKSDTSVSGWQIQALKAAYLTGLPGIQDIVRPVLNDAMKNLDRVFNYKNGSFGYRKSGDRDYSLTGVGVLAKLMWLGRPDASVRDGLVNIQSRELKYDGAGCNLYAWYYDTQACYQAQGDSWDWWKERFQEQLTARQSPDGSWLPTGGWGEAFRDGNQAGGDGALYRTTLCCLMLEVFYRYLPTSQEGPPGGEVEGLK